MTNEQLAIRIKAGIDVAENMLQLWKQNQGFIGKMAMKYKGYEDIEDLKQQGYIGLCHAVDGYDPDEGVTFLHYAAFWIQQSMRRYIEECGGVVRLPVHAHDSIRRYKKLCMKFKIYYNREPTDFEVCHFLDIGQEKLENIKHAVAMANVGSLDVPIGADDEGSLYELLPGQDNPENEVIERLQQEQLKETLWNMVDELPDHEPAVLRMRYQEGKTLKEAGEQIGISVERVRQIQSKALRNMRLPRRARVLQSLIDGEYYSRGLKGNGVQQFNRTWTSSTEYAALGFWE